MKKPSIIVKGLCVKTTEQTVLDGISFSLHENQHLAILGNAGSGKTTLAKAVAGKIHFEGKIILDFPSITAKDIRIEMVEQRYSFKNLSGTSQFYYQQRYNSFDADDSPTVYQELIKTFPADSKPTNNINFTLDILGIAHLQNAPLIQLSSGEHKKFQLAKALLNLPRILILDNPFTGLDVASVEKLNNLLEDISNKGTQIILIPGTFPIPDFITHIAFPENKKLEFFGEKEDFDIEEITTSRQTKSFFDVSLLALSSEELKNETIIEMKNVHLKYGEHVILQNLNWKIKQGDKWLLKGKNGAGKSSLLSLITGDHPQAYANEIYLFGKRRGSGESIWDIKKKTGFISPELFACFDKNITCFKAIGSGYFDTIGLFKKLSENQYNNTLQWLDFLQLCHVSNKPLHSISAGLQRMILLARALVKNPPLLVLDEPCQGLDEQQSFSFVSLIDSICTSSEKTLIYVSHDQSNIPKCIQQFFRLEKQGDRFYSFNERKQLVVA